MNRKFKTPNLCQSVRKTQNAGILPNFLNNVVSSGTEPYSNNYKMRTKIFFFSSKILFHQ